MTERGALLGGRYQLDQVIGRGGMAEVWRARDLRLERDVAVKRLRIDLASDPTFQARFRREAQSAAGLNHPNIVAVYDTGEEKDGASDVSVPYIVMELVEGVTLREVLRDGRKIVPERALEFTAGVLDALAYAHRAGIVHRDIKPANVMLTPGGTVKVMDFGIARAVADTSATMTQTAAVIGTAQYLSPEQARGEKVDNRSDIYSVGCLLYELLTSQPLFKGDSPVSVAYQHVREAPVPPSQIDDEITPAMDAVVLKSLAKDPRDRYQDASEFRDDIFRTLNHQPVMAAMPVEAPTQVIPNDPMTTTARRGVIPAAAPTSAPSPVAVTEVGTELAEEDRKSRKGIIVLSIAAVLVLAAMVYGIYTIMNPSTPEPGPSTSSGPTVKMVLVPNLTGDNLQQALAQFDDIDLVPDPQEKEGPIETKGQVIDQNPKARDEVPAGSKVTFWINSGPNELTVPSGILDAPVKEAKAILKENGFDNVSTTDARPHVPGDSGTEPNNVPAGQVLSSSHQPGETVSPDTRITLTVATGKSVVPRFTGMTEAEAAAEATRAGFGMPTFEEEETTAQAPGIIFGQDPTRNAVADRSDKITLKVAKAVTPTDPPEDNGDGGNDGGDNGDGGNGDGENP
ncbi:MAG: Stk1 family PASTA domain-containing Ser/Thr kinase [Tessaracoccus sp.]|uniref:Stk1 family PASTA domain-containing Ser/Thr kinase n=1 Tax=Tessaracoccus sp. TaxID=1971211 RepID=UPI001EBFCA39|nr:Stk1 family PASTA domain-containing Ser/Thr kinase [Tessaracoccus sp.]MBK7822432.1 Stk1 family PASTA domain-containing Ser/Thr kinase [Tessaracoccus sp.]